LTASSSSRTAGRSGSDIEKTRWTCDLAAYACTKEEIPKENPEGESLSPDGKWAAFVKDYNIYVRAHGRRPEVQTHNRR